MTERPRPLAYAALAGAGCLWGTGFLFGKLALEEMSVGHMLFYRFLFACVGFAPILVVRPFWPRRGDWRPFLAAAILGIPVQFVVQFEGLARTTVAHASLMVGTLPVLLAIAAAFFLRERLERRGWVAILVSMLGAILIVMSSAGGGASTQRPTIDGDLLVVVSLLGGVAWMLLSKQMIARYAPHVVSASVMVAGTTALALWVVATEGLPPTGLTRNVWWALAGQGLLATTAATLLWNWGVAYVPAARAGVFVNLEPVVGALLGTVVLGERLGWPGVAGGALIVAAAVVVTRSGRE